ncbi:CBS domain-containing protein [Oceanobacillus sp. AG]|uniref:CBS domain-containing protein n=1 Tax=Oceanobacillus sp. AG TaxID=2681969 RepID=UPI001E3B6C62|nr:CBS domain-containing protein [Oceanobacillus sp. AG]
MIRKVYTVNPTNSIKDLLVILQKNQIGGVPVVDDDNHLIGIISDGDVLRYLSPNPVAGLADLVYIIEDGKMEDVLREKLQTKVKAIMRKRNIVKVSPDENFETAIRILSKHHFKKLPVVDDAGRVVGVLSRGDIINNIAAKMIGE